MSVAKTIAFVTPGFADGYGDTSCIPAMQDFLKAFRKLAPGWTLLVIAMDYPYHTDTFKWHGIDVFPIGAKNRRFFRSYARNMMKTHFLIQGGMHNFDLIHGFWLNEATFTAYDWAIRNDKKVSATAMGQDVLKKNKYLKKPGLHNMQIAGLSTFHNDAFFENSGREFDEVIPWGVDMDLFSDPQPERDIDIIGVGNLIDLKRYEDWITAVANMQSKNPKIKAILVGGGKSRKRLEKQAEKLGATVDFKGHIDREAAIALIRRSKILYHPSSYESFGMVMAEALTTGTHVVAAPVGMAPDSEEVHIANDPIEAIQKMEALLQKNNGEVNDRFSADRVAERYFEFFKKQLR